MDTNARLLSLQQLEIHLISLSSLLILSSLDEQCNTFCTQQFLFTQDLITMKEDLAKLRNENAGLRLELSGLHNAGD